jgi:hypothetical protein
MTDSDTLAFGHSRMKFFHSREAFDFTIGKIAGDGHINKKNQLDAEGALIKKTSHIHNGTKKKYVG